jgi:hypothetical protein
MGPKYVPEQTLARSSSSIYFIAGLEFEHNTCCARSQAMVVVHHFTPM